jgi:hypothetical protein
MGDNYDYAVVCDPSRKYFRVLSRTLEIEGTRLREILQCAKEKASIQAKLLARSRICENPMKGKLILKLLCLKLIHADAVVTCELGNSCRS